MLPLKNMRKKQELTSEVDPTDDYVNAVICQADTKTSLSLSPQLRKDRHLTFGTVVGTTRGEPIKAPFHVYSMRQAIEEGYSDVLSNYTTVQKHLS